MAGTVARFAIFESYSDGLPDFIQLAESFGITGMRVTDPNDVDDAIQKMIDTDGTGHHGYGRDQGRELFPDDPGGAAHNEILLGIEDQQEQKQSEEGMVLV